MDNNIEGLSEIEKIELRKYIGKGYQVAEEVANIEAETNFDIQKRTLSRPSKKEKENSIVSVINKKFKNHEKARETFSDIKMVSENIPLQIYDVQYNKEDKMLTVVFQPYYLS